MELETYRELFVEETEEELNKAEDILLQVQDGNISDAQINELFRIFHSMKGNSATVGLENFSKASHAAEDLLDRVRKGETPFTPQIASFLLKVIDNLKKVVEDIRKGGDGKAFDFSALIEELKPKKEEKSAQGFFDNNLLYRTLSLGIPVYRITIRLSPSTLMKAARAMLILQALRDLGDVIKSNVSEEDIDRGVSAENLQFLLGTSHKPEVIISRIKQISDVEDIRVERLSEAELEPLLKPMTTKLEVPTTVRVETELLDRFLSLLGELVINKNRLQRITEEASSYLPEHLNDELENILADFGETMTSLQEVVTKARLIPLSTVVSRFPRMVKDLSSKFGKKIKFEIEGGVTEIDKTVAELILDPLIHLVRNSIDHGIESPEERKQAGKPEEGIIKIKARQEGNWVVIEVVDDGRGIDIKRIKEVAVAKGIINKDQADSMSDQEALEIIFTPGFSTSSDVSEISGRGVGMDVVKARVEQAGGRVEIKTEKGKGTTVKLWLPINLTIINALRFKLGEENFFIPLFQVKEALRFGPDDVESFQENLFLKRKEEKIPLFDLRKHFKMEPFSIEGKKEIFAVLIDGTQVALLCDELLRQQEIVVRPLPPYLSGMKGVSGLTVLEDGRVGFILDVESILEGSHEGIYKS